MNRIEEIFKASGASVSETFVHKGGSVGFIIPNYQRKYSWDTKHINRLFEDINQGLISLRNDQDSVTFIGTLIFAETSVKDFDGIAYSVVDGQQRLNTVILMITVLHKVIVQLKNNLSGNVAAPLSDFLSDEVKRLENNLMYCFSGKYDPISSDISAFYPRLIREESDVWSTRPNDAEYRSPVPHFIYSYLKHILNGSGEFQYEYKFSNNEKNYFDRNLNCIEENIDNKAYYDEPDADLNDLISLLMNNKYKSALFPDFNPRGSELINSYKRLGIHREDFNKLLYLAAFSSYLLNRVAVTRVFATDEKYAFEVFEALNTTGEPLTALETFKPIVSHFIDKERGPAGFLRSKSKEVFDNIDLYLDMFDSSEKKQKESANLVVALALTVEGRKESLHLDSQRKYLRGCFEKISDDDLKERFVKSIDELIDYKKRFWNQKELIKQLLGDDDREQVLFCLDFIREMNTSLTIPILSRYFSEYQKSGDIDEFSGAVKATAAFLAIWRGYFGGTNQIDSVFRDIMFKGSRHISNAKSLKTGRKFNLPIPSVSELKENYRSYLTKRKISSLELWKSGIAKQPLYSKSKVLCKFLLIVSSHNAIKKEGTCMLEKGRGGMHMQKHYIGISHWRNKDFATVEHIAPQNEAKKGDWEHDIYSEAYLIDSIGNLTLLPEKENSSVGNAKWDRKKLFYKAFAAETTSELDKAIENAKKQGLDFGKSTKEALRQGNSLPIVSSIADEESWSAELITNRTNNVSELSWYEFKDWLDLP